jgi:hypothetical protein
MGVYLDGQLEASPTAQFGSVHGYQLAQRTLWEKRYLVYGKYQLKLRMRAARK